MADIKMEHGLKNGTLTKNMEYLGGSDIGEEDGQITGDDKVGEQKRQN